MTEDINNNMDGLYKHLKLSDHSFTICHTSNRHVLVVKMADDAVIPKNRRVYSFNGMPVEYITTSTFNTTKNKIDCDHKYHF